ncbi:hypothetical protein [Saccharopolyspora mangrovi]|uniref:Uncharacterized protein n=1 Tax=Saccharopolyspora mangrovi TaxID=3082379 RepID=A0ABU6A626_9PSEU|nr:hypothetical protein [Saccharopolyspora sp. S2-29]MEB3366919.1 hypothetical protein [Saccharopolyspora sp. S2-29]
MVVMEGTEQRTVLPPARADELLGLLRALDEQRSAPALITRDGTRIDLPDELYDVLHDVVFALSRGMAITVAPRHTVSDHRRGGRDAGNLPPDAGQAARSG